MLLQSDSLHGVDGLLEEGTPFEEIEEYIEGLALNADRKSALWLYAWVEVDRQDRRRAVGDLLAGTAHVLG